MTVSQPVNWLTHLGSFVVAAVILSPLYISLATVSFKYHAVVYHISDSAVMVYLATLWSPVRFYLSRNLKDIYYLDSAHTPQQIAMSLLLRRRISAILPVLFIAATTIGTIRLLFQRNELAFAYSIELLVEGYALYSAWRFGSKLKE